MRLAMFSWRSPHNALAGGAEIYTHNLLNELVARGHDVTWFTASDAPNVRRQDISPALYRQAQGGGQYTVYRRGRDWLQAHAQEVDIAIDQVNTVPFQLARLKLDLPVMGLFHQTAEDVWWSNTDLIRALVGRTIMEPFWVRQFRDIPVAVLSKSTSTALAKFGVFKTCVIGAAAEAQESFFVFSTEDRKNNISMVSRIVGYKRVQHAIEAVRWARSSGLPLHLHIVGTGPAEEGLKRKSGNWVTWHGALPRAERNQVIAQSALHLICSKREGWGLTVTEAAMLGVPSLGYATPGLVDSITASKGFLCPESPEAMGAWITEIMRSRSWESYVPPRNGGASGWPEVADRLLSFIDVSFGG